jgi:hypothetical protein
MHYRASDNSLHFIEPEFAHLLPAGSVPITDAEADAIQLAQAPIVEPVPEPTKAELLAQIAALAAKVEAL